MANKSGLKDCSNLGTATGVATQSRTAKSGSFDGGTPPSGPKAEPVRVNGVPILKNSGVSKK